MRSLQIEGHAATTTGLHATVAAVATAYIDTVHHATCKPDTPIMIARMDCHGVGEDLNQAVRMLAVAVSQGRQLVLLPPAPQTARQECKVPASIPLSARQPWHWLAGQAIELDSIFVLSSCHKHLLKTMPEVMEAMARSSTGNATNTASSLGASALAASSRESLSLWRSHLAISRHVPRVFQRQGLLWWFQVLTTYLVRIRAPLSKLLEAHPAMQPFLAPKVLASPTSTADPASDLRWMGWNVRCASRLCDGIGPGWAPHARFTAGVHLRLGDACRSGPSKYSLQIRRCDLNLSVAIKRLRAAGVRNGTLFIASDSTQVIDQVAAGEARPFVGAFLKINRTRFETSAGTERMELAAARLNSLLEALMDMTLLARSSVLAGKMMSNFPRVALQLRVQMPVRRQPAYISLDDRPWCTRTSCREPFLPLRDQQIAWRRELIRNPSLA